MRQASEAGPERLTLVRDLLREVFGKATRSPSPSSQPQVITAERPAVKEVQVPRFFARWLMKLAKAIDDRYEKEGRLKGIARLKELRKRYKGPLTRTGR